MQNDNNEKKLESIYSKRLRAGKRRTYFFDVRSTRGNDYYLTITESRKRGDDNSGYERHKVFLYKEDFNKFSKALNEAIDYVKTELMPDFNFDAFNHDEYDEVSVNPPSKPEQEDKGVIVAGPQNEESPANDTEVVKNPDPKSSEDEETGNSSAGHEEVEKW